MDEQFSYQSQSPLARAWRAFLSISLVVVMVVVASLIGVGGAALFIYRQMGNSVAVTKTVPAKEHMATADAETETRPSLTPVQPEASVDRHTTAPTVSESTEWHFAEFSDQPRYIDVTYDGGRQHARLKVNTVLSSKPAADSLLADAPAASVGSSVSDSTSDDGETATTLSDPGSHYIVDKNTGRIVGVDGSAGAALEVRRAQPVVPRAAAPTINNPVPEVRVASPVMQYGRPLFDNDRPVQAAIPASSYVPTRKALPVYSNAADDDPSFNAAAELSDDGLPVQRAQPVTRPRGASRPYELSDTATVFGRNR